MLLVSCSDPSNPVPQSPDKDTAVSDGYVSTEVTGQDEPVLGVTEYDNSVALLSKKVEESIGHLRTKETDISGFSADGAQIIGWYDDSDQLIFMKIEQYEWVSSGFRNTIDCYFDQKGNSYIISTQNNYKSSDERKEFLINSDDAFEIDRKAASLVDAIDCPDLLIQTSIDGLRDANWGDTGAYGVVKVSSLIDVARIDIRGYGASPHPLYNYWKVMSNSTIVKVGQCDVLVELENGTSYSKWMEVKDLVNVIEIEPRPEILNVEEVDDQQTECTDLPIIIDDVNLDDINYSYGYGMELISIGNSRIAVVDGNNYDLVGELEVGEAYLRVYSRNGSDLEQVMCLDLNQSNGVAYIGLSPDEKKIYVIDYSRLTVYDVENGEAIFNTAILTDQTQPIWAGNDYLVFIKDYLTIHIADLRAGDTYSIIDLERQGLGAVDFQHACEGYLYFSASREKQISTYRVGVVLNDDR